MPQLHQRPQSNRRVQSGSIAHLLAPAEFGGLERVVEGLARGCAAAGRQIVCIAVIPPDRHVPAWLAGLAPFGVTVEPIRTGRRDYLGEMRAVASLLRHHRIGVVHTHGYRADVIGARVAHLADLPKVSTVHGFTRYGMRNRIYEWIQLRTLRHFDRVVAVSAALQRELSNRSVPASKIRLIPNGYVAGSSPPLERSAARRELGLDPAARVIGWVGRMSREKAPDVMVRALSHLGGTDTQLCAIGEGPMLGGMRQLAASCGIAARTVFAGAVIDAARLLRAFDVLALTSRTEGTPMIALEAAAARVPFVATAVGGLPEILEKDGGWLVPPDDPRALATALECVLDNSGEAARRSEILFNRVEERFSSTTWVSKHLTMYDELTGRRDA